MSAFGRTPSDVASISERGTGAAANGSRAAEGVAAPAEAAPAMAANRRRRSNVIADVPAKRRGKPTDKLPNIDVRRLSWGPDTHSVFARRVNDGLLPKARSTALRRRPRVAAVTMKLVWRGNVVDTACSVRLECHAL